MYKFLIFILFTSASLHGVDSLFMNPLEEPKIHVNNRILIRVNGKPISTYDLMKKMDLFFYRQFPEYTSSIGARSQFYDMSWRSSLEELIDKELILADAKESKVEVSGGDVRQELESSFGPNIIDNLDKAGITFEDATKIMQEEIIIRRMIGGRVHAKAIRQVTPMKVRQFYEEFIQDPSNARQNQWKYQIITIKERNLEKTEQTAKEAYKMIMQGVPLDQLSNKLKEENILGRKGKLTVSISVSQNDHELSKEYGKILAELEPGMYSQPFSHKSRVNNSMVFRILLLEEKVSGGIPSYKEMEPILKDKLIDKAVDDETTSYLTKLRQHYHIRKTDVEDNLPADYRPFVLK